MQTIFIFEVIIFVTVILMHIAKRNSTIVAIYLFQSLALVGILVIHAYETSSLNSFIIAFIVFVIKVVITPRFFFKLINRSHLNLSTSTYLTVPISLGVVAGLTFFSQSNVFSPLNTLLAEIPALRMMLISSIFISFFLIINRKGALSQIIGVLSLENTIVAFGFFVGLKQTFSLELAILFDIFLWIAVASVFIRFIYRHFGSYDVTKMTGLKK